MAVTANGAFARNGCAIMGARGAGGGISGPHSVARTAPRLLCLAGCGRWRGLGDRSSALGPLTPPGQFRCEAVDTGTKGTPSQVRPGKDSRIAKGVVPPLWLPSLAPNGQDVRCHPCSKQLPQIRTGRYGLSRRTSLPRFFSLALRCS